jgi:protein TonB
LRRGTLVLVACLIIGAGGGSRAIGDDLPASGQHVVAGVGRDDGVYVEELPQAMDRTAPVYPEAARRAGITGTVMVEALVGKDGHVQATKIVRSIPELDAAAEAAVKKWVFEPAKSKGEPVAVWVAVPIKFSIDGRSAPPAPLSSRMGIPVSPRGLRIDARVAFERDLAALRARGPVVPSDSDFVARMRLIRSAGQLLPRPAPTPEAIAEADSAFQSMSGESTPESWSRAVQHLVRALNQAPWWGPPYRDLALALENLDRRDEAAPCMRLYLVAVPDAADRDAMTRKLHALELH